MESNFKSQEATVKAHLLEHGVITSWDAISRYRITRLAVHIHNLREQGHNIATDMVYRDGKKWANYVYKGNA